MAIVFYCNGCKKKVNAPDSAGGKYGKCPYCDYRCYIPLPKSDEEEDLTLAPVDPNEELEYKQLMRETYHVREELLHETEEPPEPDGSIHTDETQLKAMVIKYLRHMTNGQLDEAGQIADKIAVYRQQTKKILEQLITDSVPDAELKNIPPKVLQGFIKNMITRLS